MIAAADALRDRRTPRCSIVIPVFNRASVTQRCLDALLARPAEYADGEIIVVDDGSSDLTPRVLADYGDRITAVTHEANLGFGASCNDGAAIAAGEYLVFLNNDTIPQPGWLDALVRYADEHPAVAVVGSKLLLPDNTIQHAGAVVCQDRYPRHLYRGFPADHPAVNKSRRFQIVTGACMLVRRAAFDEVGGFDLGFANAYEDHDLCLRLGECGYEVHYCHDSVVYHFESVSREGRTADLEWSTRLFRERWGDRLLPDDLRYYLEDGLLEVRYWESYPAQLSVSPLLATVDGYERERQTEQLLEVRARQVFELLRANTRVEIDQQEAALPGTLDGETESPAGERRVVDHAGSRLTGRLEAEVTELRAKLASLEAKADAARLTAEARARIIEQQQRAIEQYRSAAEERLQLILRLESQLNGAHAEQERHGVVSALEAAFAQQAEALDQLQAKLDQLETAFGPLSRAWEIEHEQAGRRTEAVLEARLRALELDKEQAEAAAQARLRALELDREQAEAAAQARLRVIEEQQRALEAYRRAHPIERLKLLLAPRLGVLYQYPPRPLEIPDHYRRAQPPHPTPLISIVTPSFNQGSFVERTIKSVLDQAYPALEYIVQDGGSSDETMEVLQRHEHSFSHLESKRDDGFAHGLNLGFRRATGDILAYLNSDDLLLPGALNYVARFFDSHPGVDVVYGNRVVIDEYDAEIGRWVLPPHDDEVLLWADYVPQETLFWRRSIWERVGAKMDESFRFAVDWDLLLRFREAGARFARLPRFLGAFRVHPHQKTSAEIASVGMEEMQRLRQRCHGRPVLPDEVRQHQRGYLRRHVIFHKLYRLGLLRY